MLLKWSSPTLASHVSLDSPTIGRQANASNAYCHRHGLGLAVFTSTVNTLNWVLQATSPQKFFCVLLQFAELATKLPRFFCATSSVLAFFFSASLGSPGGPAAFEWLMLWTTRRTVSVWSATIDSWLVRTDWRFVIKTAELLLWKLPRNLGSALWRTTRTQTSKRASSGWERSGPTNSRASRSLGSSSVAVCHTRRTLNFSRCSATSISSIVSVADRMRIAPGEAASNQPNFDTFWTCKQEKLEVMCRQCRQYGKPCNLYFTTASAEWKHYWHRACTLAKGPWVAGEGSGGDDPQLQHCHWSHAPRHCPSARRVSLQEVACCATSGWARRGAGQRFFQARGTLHVHAVAWAHCTKGDVLHPRRLNGASNLLGPKSCLLENLENKFGASTDVQRHSGICHRLRVEGLRCPDLQGAGVQARGHQQVAAGLSAPLQRGPTTARNGCGFCRSWKPLSAATQPSHHCLKGSNEEKPSPGLVRGVLICPATCTFWA